MPHPFHGTTRIAVLLLLLLAGGATRLSAEEPSEPVGSAPLATEDDARRLCEAFLDQITAGEYGAAFALLRPHFPISEERFDALEEETKRQLGLAGLEFGSTGGHVLISRTNLSDTVLKYRFLQKFPHDVMVWDLVLYRPADAWLINGVGFDDDLTRVFGEPAGAGGQ